MLSFSPVYRKGKTATLDRFAVWTAVSDHLDSSRNTWDYLNRVGRIPHLLWNPATGLVYEGMSLNRLGTLFPCSGVQVAVVGSPAEPFTNSPLYGAEIVCKALNDLDIPEIWPIGPPGLTLPYRPVQKHLKPGHYSADQINPEWTGVGGIDVRRIFARVDA